MRAVMVVLMIGFSALVAPVEDVSGAEAPFDRCQDCTIATAFAGGEWYGQAGYFGNDDGQCEGSGYGCQRCSNGGGETELGCDDGAGELHGPFESRSEAEAEASADCGDCSDQGFLALAATRIESGAIAELAQMIASSEGGITINAERGAVQARGCGGRIALHVPVGAAFLNALQAELASLTQE